MNKLAIWAAAVFLCLATQSAPAVAKNGTATVSSSAQFNLGDLSKASGVPSNFSFKSQSTAVGVYRARLSVKAEDLKKPLYLVVRTQSDATHRFGWVRAFVNSDLVATEAKMYNGRLTVDITKNLKAGDVRLTIQGAAYAGTSIDFSVVPEEGVMEARTGKTENNATTVVTTAGPFQTTGRGQSSFSDAFNLSADEALIPMKLHIKAVREGNNKFAWVRASINGVLVATEQNFANGEAVVDLTGKTKVGANKVELLGAAQSSTSVGWYISQQATAIAAKPADKKPAASTPAPAVAAQPVQLVRSYGTLRAQ